MNLEEILILAALLILLAAIKALTPKIRGWSGESTVARVLDGLAGREYRVLNNVMLRSGRGTTQIDHVVVSVYGIFIIETKNYSGLITGREFADEWTKKVRRRKYPFHNPLKQNYAHMKALEKLLGLSEDSFIPIVVFSDNTKIRVESSRPVVYMSELKKEIKSYRDWKFDVVQVEKMADRIDARDINSKQTRKEHIVDIRSKVREEKKSVKRGICPRCGGRLVKRKGKYGKFLGCSNYPRCRYTFIKK